MIEPYKITEIIFVIVVLILGILSGIFIEKSIQECPNPNVVADLPDCICEQIPCHCEEEIVEDFLKIKRIKEILNGT